MSHTYHPATFALQAVITQSNAVERELARILGLNPTDFRALTTLTSLPDGPVTVGRLGAALGTSPATTSAIVDRLERAGYAARHRGEADRRQVTLEATPLSWRTIMDAMRPLMADADAHVKSLPQADRRVITDFLNATVAQLSRHLGVLAALPAHTDAPSP